MNTRRRSNYVNADPNRLPTGWYRDPFIADEVRATVRALHREGVTGIDISRRTGVSSRSVGRILGRVTP